MAIVVAAIAIPATLAIAGRRDAGQPAPETKPAVESPAPRKVAPAGFLYEACDGYSDRRLPPEKLGGLQDDKGPRQWMVACEDSAKQTFDNNCMCLWLWTTPLYEDYQEFVVRVNVGTVGRVVVSCHLVQPDKSVKRVELAKERETPKDTVFHYFSAPAADHGSHLLVFLAMDPETYKAIAHEPRFRIQKN